ncbi:MAG: diaminopimelate epimerase [Candidatus Omnitrophica bacterium]|nr:diaminopimelate epimerase [Candidatus Omnitrophota bacterium]
MEGLGNDYIYFDCLDGTLENPSAVAPRLSDRHFGIGGDGIVLILPSDKADFRMRMFNADGSEAEMCGNAIRCVGKFLYERGKTRASEIAVETGNGVLDLQLRVEENEVTGVRVDMGEPILEGPKIPTASQEDRVIGHSLEVDGKTFDVTCVSMGNPHCAIFVDEITDEHIQIWGPKIEVHPFFPRKVNVEFIQILSPTEIRMRVWERGTGETLACGTGACAVAVAANLNGKTEREVTVHLLGGDLEIEWAENNHVYMTGPGKFVFDGEVEI